MRPESLSTDLAALASSVPHGFLLRRHLEAIGLSSRNIATLRQNGSLARVHRGVYRIPADGEHPSDRFRARVGAVLAVDPSRVVTGNAAAVVLGLPVHHDARAVHVAVDSRGGSSARSTVRTVAAPPTDQILEVRGGRVAGPARAALDAARLTSVVSGVVIADAALARGLVFPDDITDVLEGLRGLGGVARSRVCAELASAGSESPGESWSAVVMHAHGTPRPVRQQEFVDEQGLIGRVDFWWPEHRVVGEFDGRMKYRRENPAGRRPEDVVWDEKVREDRLRAQDVSMVRWSTGDLGAPARLVHRLRRALGC